MIIFFNSLLILQQHYESVTLSGLSGSLISVLVCDHLGQRSTQLWHPSPLCRNAEITLWRDHITAGQLTNDRFPKAFIPHTINQVQAIPNEI